MDYYMEKSKLLTTRNSISFSTLADKFTAA